MIVRRERLWDVTTKCLPSDRTLPVLHRQISAPMGAKENLHGLVNSVAFFRDLKM